MIPFPGMAPIPVYVSDSAYLSFGDFASAESIYDLGETRVRVALTPDGREKINHLGAQNQSAQALDDYVGLLLYTDGEPARALTIIYEPIEGYTIDIRGLAPEHLDSIITSLGACS